MDPNAFMADPNAAVYYNGYDAAGVYDRQPSAWSQASHVNEGFVDPNYFFDESFGADPDFGTQSNASSTPVTQTSNESKVSKASSMTSKSSRSSSKKTNSRPAAAQVDNTKRKKNKKSKVATEPAVDEMDEEEDEFDGDPARRNKFLERNRIAASKCRQKKKEWVSDLEETRNGLENRHADLQTEYQGLVGEVSRMKNELMSHASCHDPNIDMWIENEARKFVQTQRKKSAVGPSLTNSPMVGNFDGTLRGGGVS